MKSIAKLSLLLIALVVSGCKDNSVDPEELKTFIPLKTGNYWLYMNYSLNADGTGEIPDLWKFGFIIDGSVSLLNGEKNTLHYKLFTCGEKLKPYYDKPGTFKGSKLIYQGRDGFYYSGIEKNDTIKMSFNDLIFPYPTEKGRTVQGHIFYYESTGSPFNIPDSLITEYTCVSTDSLITTPSGEFRCIVYKMAYFDIEPLFRDEVYYFIKPEVGIVAMVGMVYHYKTQKYSYMDKTLLTDYKIN
ncbi:MAG: hypothetical protein ACM34K_19385 [Bacillota bacterium]